MRGCEPCQGRKAAAISIVSCVPWDCLPRAFYALERIEASEESGAFLFFKFVAYAMECGIMIVVL